MSRYTEEEIRQMALSYEQFFNAQDWRCTELCLRLAVLHGMDPRAVHHRIITIAHGGPQT